MWATERKKSALVSSKIDEIEAVSRPFFVSGGGGGGGGAGGCLEIPLNW